MENKYILKKGDFYLSDINKLHDELKHQDILINFNIDNDFRKLYDDYELAEDDRKLIFIETGLNLEIRKFKKEE